MERYRLVHVDFEGDRIIHIENVSYEMACAFRKLLKMTGECDTTDLYVEECED
jgi:hypothetical protein